MGDVQFLRYYFSRFLGHFGSPQKTIEPEQAIRSEASTNIDAIENKTTLNIEPLFFIGLPPLLVIIGMIANKLSICRIQKKFDYV
ncbi:hypothetical protein SAMN05446037_10376 [Anaerovirgula multivorans]|uniref:Uncharacterized protein n=1 Tax=Anaerovirgula multivorans TaxID=312168 RepID=A0A239JM49_9FIRM|nr:hypothetical protein SAMN05446037_10376 [Anaerovirgula multivorans]